MAYPFQHLQAGPMRFIHFVSCSCSRSWSFGQAAQDSGSHGHDEPLVLRARAQYGRSHSSINAYRD